VAAAAWIDEHVAFPNAMVDRITPATTDPLVVTAEWFGQWVLEDAFSAGRPALEDVGVQLVADVAPYELMKLRLLNGAHQAMAYAGMLLGHTHVHDAVADPAIASLLRAFFAETKPAVPPVAGVDLDDYCATLLRRFANIAIADTLARLAESSWDRVPTFVLPAARETAAAGRPVAVAGFVAATWARYFDGAPAYLADVRALPAFAAAYTAADDAIGAQGVRAAITTLFG
jgi:mannitol 2-dehydrogenase